MEKDEGAAAGGEEDQTVDRVPSWLRATTENLSGVDIDQPISGAMGAEYRTLANAYGQASQEGQTASAETSKMYAFVGAVLGMYMKEDAPNDPFQPAIVLEGRRSPTTTDFVDKSDVLAAIAKLSTHPLVKARCADLAWLLDRKRSDCAQIAIDAYVRAVHGIGSGTLVFSYSPERKELHSEVKKLMARALQVARGARKQKVRTDDLHKLTRHLFDRAIEVGWVVGAIWYGRLLSETNLLPPQVIAASLEQLLQRSDLHTWVSLTVQAWNLIAQCYRVAGLEADQQRCLNEAAEALVGHALTEAHTAMIRAHFLSDAIIQLQGVQGKRDQIKLLLREAQAGINDEMSTFSQEIDLTDIVEPTIQEFEELGPIDQLFRFASLDTSPDVDVLREQALQAMSKHPIGSMFATTIHDREGKVVEKAPGHTQGAPSEGAVKHAIARDEQLRRHLVAAGLIEVARQVMNQNAFVSQGLLLWVIGSSPFVPPELKGTYAYGFSRFIQEDFIAATYVLTPLLEASLRHVLKQHGVDVSSFDDSNETQEDKTISALFSDFRDNLDRIFTAADVSNLEGIYLSKFGPHLRHSLAHGLLTDGDPFGSDAIYGCRLMFRLCMLPLFPYLARMRAILEKRS